MKLNKETLKRIIKEELEAVLGEATIPPVDPLLNIPDGEIKDKIKNLIDQGGEYAEQGYQLAYAMQDPSMGQPYEGSDYPADLAKHDTSMIVNRFSPFLGKFAIGFHDKYKDNRFNHKHAKSILDGTVEVDYDQGRGPIPMNLNFYFDGNGPISLYTAASDLAYAESDYDENWLGGQYSNQKNTESISKVQILLKKMMISASKKLIFRSREAAQFFGIKSMRLPKYDIFYDDKLGGSGVFKGTRIWRENGKYSPPNEQEISQKLENGTIIINN